jgi:hypothetical protein
MRGDQLARQWRIIRAIESSPNGLTVAEIAKREETGIRTIYRDLEALQVAGFPLYTEKAEKSNRWAFVDTFKFKIPTPFTLTELMSLHAYGDLVKVFKGIPFYDSLDSLFKKAQATLPPQALSYLDQVQSVFHVGIKPYKEYGKYREILNQVCNAALEQKRIEMIYHPLQPFRRHGPRCSHRHREQPDPEIHEPRVRERVAGGNAWDSRPGRCGAGAQQAAEAGGCLWRPQLTADAFSSIALLAQERQKG